MAIFLDTSFIIAFLNQRDSRNQRATQLLEKIWDNKFGNPVTSDYIFDECYTLLLSRIKNYKMISNLFDFFWGNPSKQLSKFITLQFVDEFIFNETCELAQKYHDTNLSFTDLTILTICDRKNIEYLASFDSDFDGRITRIM